MLAICRKVSYKGNANNNKRNCTMSNYPDDFNQAAFDAYWGVDEDDEEQEDEGWERVICDNSYFNKRQDELLAQIEAAFLKGGSNA
jgi:hypothetical protein